jgi:DNA-binding response OmpR family regulator
MRILIIEDEIRLAEALRQIMIEQKYTVDMVHDGESGLDYAQIGLYDVIILDVMIPKLSGFDVVKALRTQKNMTPILLLTAKDDIIDKVMGLDCGADDYMTKPFSPEELLARIRALSRRLGDVVLEELSFADLTLNLSNNSLYKGAKSVHLGFKEYEVLKILMSNPKQIIPKEELIIKVWGSESNAEDNNVEAYISFLRKKFFYLGSQVTIGTIRKVGYRLEVEEK